jgi:hypothetical protein
LDEPLQKVFSAPDSIFVSTLGPVNNPRLFLAFQVDRSAEDVTNVRVLFHNLHKSLQGVIAPKRIIGSNEPHVFAVRDLNSAIKIAKVAYVRFMPNVIQSLIDKAQRNFPGTIRRTIVHYQDLKILIRLLKNGFQASRQELSRFVAGHNETHSRVFFAHRYKGKFSPAWHGEAVRGVEETYER